MIFLTSIQQLLCQILAYTTLILLTQVTKSVKKSMFIQPKKLLPTPPLFCIFSFQRFLFSSVGWISTSVIRQLWHKLRHKLRRKLLADTTLIHAKKSIESAMSTSLKSLLPTPPLFYIFLYS